MTETIYSHGIESYSLISIDDASHSDIRGEIAIGAKYGSTAELYRVVLSGGTGYARSGNTMEVVFFPVAGRGGVAWGGDAEWTEADSAEDALERYLTDNMLP